MRFAHYNMNEPFYEIALRRQNMELHGVFFPRCVCEHRLRGLAASRGRAHHAVLRCRAVVLPVQRLRVFAEEAVLRLAADAAGAVVGRRGPRAGHRAG